MSLKPINDYIQNMRRSGIRRIMDSAILPDILHLEGKYVRVSMAADDDVVIEGPQRVCTFIKKNS